MRKLCNLAELGCYGFAVARIFEGNVNGFFALLAAGVVISIVKKLFPLK
ncbi:hypothetical protein PHYNN_242 [Pantoea phage Phynn]|nr:hypothetical protein PHYNN_242 [Pantoea phage Phynn]